MHKNTINFQKKHTFTPEKIHNHEKSTLKDT